MKVVWSKIEGYSGVYDKGFFRYKGGHGVWTARNGCGRRVGGSGSGSVSSALLCLGMLVVVIEGLSNISDGIFR